MKQRLQRLRLFSFLLLAASVSFSQTPRGRIQIDNGTLVTDIGTLLRGTYISTDVSDNVPGEDEIAAIKDLGLNCIHLYAECAVLHTPGEQHILVDSIVNMAERDSLYVVITIGRCGETELFDSAFVNGFWRFYAPRYKDKTHLIFEILNEPPGSAPYDTNTIQKERRAYDIIRSLAPETHIQLMCYANATNADSAIQDIKQLGDIDWSNASVSVHGYGTCSEELRPYLNTFVDSGYAVSVTEFVSIENKYPNLAYTRVFEEEFISYMHFVSLHNMVNNSIYFKDPIENSEIRWTPDFGIWPNSLTEINYRDPFQEIEAAYYDEGSGFRILFLKTDIGFINDGDYVAYYNLDFSESPSSINIKASSGNQLGGIIHLVLDSINGQSIGNYTINYTEGWDKYENFSFPVTNEIEGIHKLFFFFEGNQQYDIMNLRSFQFSENSINASEQMHGMENSAITVYPNPTKNQLWVNINEIATFEIYSIQGQLLIKKNISNSENMVPVDGLTSGNYVIKIVTNSKFSSQILTIE